jgi:hypothetical protein
VADRSFVPACAATFVRRTSARDSHPARITVFG